MRDSIAINAMDTDDEIKCWNKSKRQFDFRMKLNSYSSTSPRHNVSSTLSCVSAITFDDQLQHEFKSGYMCSGLDDNLRQTLVPSKLFDNEDDCGNTEGMTRELTTTIEHRDFILCNAGSLISRITTGYIGSLNGEKHESTVCNAVCTSVENCFANS